MPRDYFACLATTVTCLATTSLLSPLCVAHTCPLDVRRPYGVGLLVAAYDKSTGAHLYQTCPSGNVYEYYATAIGARNQSAKTYLEKNYESFATSSKDELIMHSLRSLAGCVSGEGELNKDNGSVAIVGEDCAFTIIEGEELAPYLARLEGEGGDAADAPAAMEE